MSDLISREAAIDALSANFTITGLENKYTVVNYINGVIEKIKALPTIEERKKGKWDERKVFDTEDSDIAQMQSAKCSMCGKYHTTPYLYFFDNFNFCPNCGADMRGGEDEQI